MNHIASFALPEPFRLENGFAIYDNALLFRAGSYPDKDFEISPDEMAAAAADFSPVAGNLDHTDWLRGEACKVTKAWIDPMDRGVLRGVVRVPAWLNTALKDTQKKLSAEWDRATKRLKGIALCANPRIPDAALASFAAEVDPEELAHLRSLSPALAHFDRQSRAAQFTAPSGVDPAEFAGEPDPKERLKATLERVDKSVQFRMQIAALFAHR